jgi:hypothetical protein
LLPSIIGATDTRRGLVFTDCCGEFMGFADEFEAFNPVRS